MVNIAKLNLRLCPLYCVTQSVVVKQSSYLHLVDSGYSLRFNLAIFTIYVHKGRNM
jgi:hypothetical protein